MTCKDCVHDKVCTALELNGILKVSPTYCGCFKDKSLIVELPVKVGQTVWYIKGGYYNAVNKTPCAIEVTEINQKHHGKTLDWGFIANGTRYRFSSIGKTVFLTREEAQQKLKECKGNAT